MNTPFTPHDLASIKRMCDIVLNNPCADPELSGLALSIGHHPEILAIPSPAPFSLP